MERLAAPGPATVHRPSCGFCAGRDRPRPPLLGVSACVPMRPPPPRNTDDAASSRARRLVCARRRGWAARTGEAEAAGDARLQLRRLARADAGVRDRQGRQGRARADRRRLRGPAGRPPRRGRLVPLRGHDRRGGPGRAARGLRRAPALPAAVRQVVHRPSRPRQVAPRGGGLRAPSADSHRPRRRRDLRRPERRPRGRQLHRGPRAAEPRDRDARRTDRHAHQRPARPGGGHRDHGPAGGGGGVGHVDRGGRRQLRARAARAHALGRRADLPPQRRHAARRVRRARGGPARRRGAQAGALLLGRLRRARAGRAVGRRTSAPRARP